MVIIFSETELPKEICRIDTIHEYVSKIEQYNIERFQELIIHGQVRPI